jgi:hypothetical protein
MFLCYLEAAPIDDEPVKSMASLTRRRMSPKSLSYSRSARRSKRIS